MIRNSSNKTIIHCNLMQAFVAAAHDEHAAVVIHNTRSCSSIALHAYFGLRERISGSNIAKQGKGNNLFCTALSDKDAVFGGNEKLEHCLLDICQERRPDYIIVACGCVPGVVGDDAETVCKTVRNKTGIPVLLLPGFGFMVPGFLDMVLAATGLLFQEFTYPLAGMFPKKKDSAVIIGMSSYYISKEVFLEIREFFALFGITRLYTPPVGETKQEYQEMASVSLAVALCLGVVQKEEGKKLGKKFAQIMGVPLLDLNGNLEPSETMKTFQSAIRLIGKGDGLERVILDKYIAYEKKKMHASGVLAGKSCLLAVGLPFRFFQPQGTIRFLQSLGLEVKGFLLLDTATVGKRAEADAFIRANNLNMKCYSISEADADILVTGMPLQIRMKQFIYQPQHFSLEGWGRVVDRLTELMLEK